jgi:MSHA pilin protein MshA
LIQLRSEKGFTLIELIIVIVILGILSVVAAPRFLDISTDAKIASINAIASQVKSAASLAQNKARATGLRPAAVNPGSIQTNYFVEFGFGKSEVDFRNLCPESIAEGADRLDMLDFLDISSELQTRINNQYTLIGYDIPVRGVPINQGCYVIYDSFGLPNCTVTSVTVDC